ncbi:MAG: 4Fe-4S binding protein [Spirochaetia bacterium]|jgi:polyferredoxin|nr:4Fe-4S binding protein [Spirochaetia bacterium]
MKNKKLSLFKISLQIIVVLAVASITAAGFMAEKGIALPAWVPTCLHGICPFGGVAALGRVITGSIFIPRTGAENLYNLAAVLAGTLLFGALFCGWLCPLGSVQDWVFRAGRRLRLTGKKWFSAPRSGLFFKIGVFLTSVLPYLRFAVLGLILFATYRSFNLVFSHIDPFYALFHIWTGTALPLSMAVLGGVLVLSLFIRRPWCRWLCPFGAVLGFAGKIALFTVRRNSELCIGCKACDRACPSGIKISEPDKITDSRCSRCLECIESCPVPGTLLFSSPSLTRDRRAVLSPARAAAAAAVILFSFFIPFAAENISDAMTPRTEGAVIRSFYSAGENTGSEDSAVHSPDGIPAQDLTGSMTLNQAASVSGQDVSKLLALLGLPDDFDPEVKLRDVEEYYGEKNLRWIKEKVESGFAVLPSSKELL